MKPISHERKLDNGDVKFYDQATEKRHPDVLNESAFVYLGEGIEWSHGGQAVSSPHRFHFWRYAEDSYRDFIHNLQDYS
jgi:hypothetical protein